MNKNTAEDLNDMASECHNLIAAQQSLLLSTASLKGIPEMSYAPYIRDQDGCFYIYVSELATHTVNLLNNPQVSLLFIRPETETRNIFARERTVFHCSVSEVFREGEQFTLKLQALQEKFGEVVEVLRALSDFHLFCLRPISGRYIAGFGRAYQINVADGTLSAVQSTKK